MSRIFHVLWRFLRGWPSRRRLAVWLLALLLAAAGGLYGYLTRPDRVAAAAAEMLADATGASVRIETATLRPDGRLTLSGVRLRAPGLTGPRGELLTIDRMRLRVDFWRAVRGEMAVDEITLIRPMLQWVRLEDGELNWRRLDPPAQTEDRGPVDRLPEVTLRSGRLRCGEVRDGVYHRLGELPVSGSLRAVAGSGSDAKPAYEFRLTERAGPDAPDPAGDDVEAALGEEADREEAGDQTNPIEGATLTGRVDLQQQTVQTELQGFALTETHRDLLPRHLRRWWDRLEPSGRLPSVRFRYNPEDGPGGRIEIRGLALTLPFHSPGETEADRPRMSGVEGTVRFGDGRIEVERVEGSVEGLAYSVQGTIEGYDPAAPFRLAMKTRPYRVPERPEYRGAMPLPVQEALWMLQPVGWMRASLTLRRTERHGPVDYEGTVRILSGDDVLEALAPDRREAFRNEDGRLDSDHPDLVSRVKYRKFPYELSHLDGRVHFDDEAIEIRGLTGRTPGGGRATIEGRIAPPGDEPGVGMTITATDVRYTQALKRALPPRQRKAVETLFHRPSYDRLREAGFFVTRDQRETDEKRLQKLRDRLQRLEDDSDEADAASDAGGNEDRETDADPKDRKQDRLQEQIAAVEARLEKPVFELGGRGDVEVNINRPPGPDEDLIVRTSIDLSEAAVLTEHFPYPLRVDGGRVELSPSAVQLNGIRGRGLHGGVGGLVGRIDLEPVPGEPFHGRDAEKEVFPRMAIYMQGLPLDGLLRASLPEERRRWLREMRLSGLLDVRGRIFRPENAEDVDFELAVDLKEGEATPGGGRYTLEDLNGRLHVSRDRLRIERIEGRRNEARIQLNGEVDWSDPEKPGLELRLSGEGLRLDAPVLDLVAPAVDDPEPLRAFWERRRPAGPFAAKVRYTVQNGERDYRVELRPAELSFRKGERRVRLESAEGAIVVEPGGIRLADLAGRIEGSRITLDGTVRPTAERWAELDVTVRGERFGPTLRSALPDAARRVLNAVDLNGEHELRIPRLVLEEGAEGSEAPGMEAEGELRLRGVACDPGLAVRDLNGVVRFETASADRGGAPRLRIELDADWMRVGGRVFEAVRAELRSETETSRLVIPTLKARCCDGTITGSGTVDPAEQRYRLSLLMDDADLSQLLRDPEKTETPARPSSAASGGDAAAMEGDAAGGSPQVDGLVTASLGLDGSWGEDAGWRGQGKLRVYDASLEGVPMSMGLLHMAHLRLPVEDEFESAEMRFHLRGSRMLFERIELGAASSMRFAGRGSVDYDAERLDLTLTTSNPAGLDLGPLTELIDGFRNQLITLGITGSLDQPEVRVRQLSGLDRVWRDVFGDEPSWDGEG